MRLNISRGWCDCTNVAHRDASAERKWHANVYLTAVHILSILNHYLASYKQIDPVWSNVTFSRQLCCRPLFFMVFLRTRMSKCLVWERVWRCCRRYFVVKCRVRIRVVSAGVIWLVAQIFKPLQSGFIRCVGSWLGCKSALQITVRALDREQMAIKDIF